MNTNLHRADYTSTTVKFFPQTSEGPQFATVEIQDDSGNAVILYFKDLTDVNFFASRIYDGSHSVSKTL